MAGAERIDKTHPMGESFAEVKAVLDEVLRFYKWRRHAHGFPEEVYFLLSRCAYACLSLWRSDQESKGDFFRRVPAPTVLRIGLDWGKLCAGGGERSEFPTDWDADHLTNDTKWFEFWIKTLEQADPRGAALYQEFSTQVLACVGDRNWLRARAGGRIRKTLHLFLQTNEAGRVLLRTLSLLADVVQAILRYFATLDGRTCVREKIALLTGLLNEMRQVIVWETPAMGPYAPAGDGLWRMRSPLNWLCRDRTQGVLTVIPRREGGEILCIYNPAPDTKGRRGSWVRRVTSLKGTYEETLFATWSSETGEHCRNPRRFPGVTACWTVQYAEAQRLETLARQVDLLLAALQGNPLWRRLIVAVRSVLRNGSPRWKPTAVPWTYVRQLSQLLERLTLTYREASLLGGDDAAERVVAKQWASGETTAEGTDPSRGRNEPGGAVSRGAAPPDMAAALNEVKFVLPKSDRDAPEKPQPSSPSSEQSASAPVTQQASVAVPSTEAEAEVPAEAPPEKPELSREDAKAVEVPAEAPPEEPELSREDARPVEAPAEVPSEEPQLSRDDSKTADVPAEVPSEKPEFSHEDSRAMEVTAEVPSEEPELSREDSAAADVPAEVPPEEPSREDFRTVEVPAEVSPEEPALSREDSRTEDVAAEALPAEPELSEEDSRADVPLAIPPEAPAPATPEEIGCLPQLPPAEATLPTPPTESEVERVAAARPPKVPAPKPARAKKATKTSRSDDTVDALLMKLLEHHAGPAKTRDAVAFSAAELQRDLGWNQSQIQRAMTSIFGPKPFGVYKKKCEDRTISTFLKAQAGKKTRRVLV